MEGTTYRLYRICMWIGVCSAKLQKGEDLRVYLWISEGLICWWYLHGYCTRFAVKLQTGHFYVESEILSRLRNLSDHCYMNLSKT